ncbi:MAG: glyoxalase family protein [Solirubrobacteraceae bacterium]|jgi:glyoxalase family protein|nr:glyoxalase family protein [Solirubrobacteraceae bacterium]
MSLEGIHHVTAITGDAPRNVDFYTRALGLRMVKKTVNFDAPDVYHLYYGDERGHPGSILTFFEFPGAARGRAGAGMVHAIAWRVASPEALEFWAQRLEAEGVDVTREADRLDFADPEGLHLALTVDGSGDAPLRAARDGVPEEHALLGFADARAYAADPARGERLFDALGFQRAEGDGDVWRVAGQERGARYALDAPPPEPGVQGAGTVHHIAWSAADDAELGEWRERVAAAAAHPTPIIDRQYFHSVYFREPNGVLFELATRDIGFDVDEPLETLGQALKLPAQHEPLRERLERTLTPL